ncbi:DUF1990 family protein [Deinococcus fonticola]|uniref:DUF1990 family protein n=1 Tax=Deinococcus fonticola TaxID=2528713 RepID=UPI001F0F2DFA|nr:DUF1990 family protein [Deinococcus fonticola]
MDSENMDKSVQAASTGSGRLTERRYWVDVQRPQCSPQDLIEYIKTHIEEFSPSLLADFEKVKGRDNRLSQDDEFHIKILGPWNGMVRVTEVDANTFEFMTLEGHPEAGRIRFSATPDPDLPDTLHFEIHSVARSRDGLVAFMYDTVGIGKKVQEQVWRTFCQRVSEHCGGEQFGDIQVRTVTEEDVPDMKESGGTQ